MLWNWERPDWPNFTWDAALLQDAEQRFLVNSGVLLGAFKHLGAEEREQLTVESMSDEAMTSSEIEGEILDRASVQSSIRKQLGFAADDRRIPVAERGMAEMMVSLYRSSADPLTETSLFEWHRMLLGGLGEAGRYRTGEEPMQIVSGHSKVHYEAPPSARVPREMAAFLAWFNQGGLPALTRAGIAHVYFLAIHPFEDGNGRIGRAISEKALAQSAGQPTPIALATTISRRRKAYYGALEATNSTNEITGWLQWFVEAGLEAQGRSLGLIAFLIAKTKLFDHLRGQLNPRQEKALVRIFREGPEGFKGGLSAANYMSITGAPSATATRDLSDLVAKGALSRTGERRHARYWIADESVRG